MWLHQISDLAIFLSYISIPIVLWTYARRKPNVPFSHLYWLFGIFIIGCGFTHFMGFIVAYFPVYRLSGLVKLITAVASWLTMLALVRVAPVALSMRMPADLEREIVARREAELTSLRAEQRLKEAQRIARVGSWEYIPESRHRVWSDQIFALLDFDPSSGIPPDKEIRSRVHPEDRALVDETILRAVTDRRGYELTFRLVSHVGAIRWMHVIGHFDDAGDPAMPRLFGTMRDVTREKTDEQRLEAAIQWLQEANEHLEQQILLSTRQATQLEENKAELEAANSRLSALASTDGLTGIRNRRAFDGGLEHETQRARRYEKPLTLLVVDVDHFKAYNDEFGHLDGDEVLKQIAVILTSTLRTTDIVARFGGEEFVVLLPELTSEQASAACSRIHTAMRQLVNARRPITVSIGAAIFSPELTSLMLIDQADKALYEAKKLGRNCTVFYGSADALQSLS